MCYDGQCMCLDVVTVVLIFAITSVALTGIGSVYVTGVLVYVNAHIAKANGTSIMGRDFGNLYMTNFIFIIILSYLLLGFSISVRLINGIVGKKPGHVKAYLIYGSMMLIMYFVTSVYFILQNDRNGIYALIGCVIYGITLKMIHMTYKKISLEAELLEYLRKKLAEDPTLEYQLNMTH